MNIQLKKDLQHQYLEVSFEETEEKNYEITMLVQNQIGCILPCESTKINGVRVIRYEIGGKVSLAKYFESQELRYDIFWELMHSLCQTLDDIECYLLTAQGLCISLEYVFYNKETRTFGYCYMPEQTTDTWMAVKSFSEQLLSHLDYEDGKMVQQGYLLYRKTHEESFELKRYVEELDKGEEEKLLAGDVYREVAEPVVVKEALEAYRVEEDVPIEFWNTEELYEETKMQEMLPKSKKKPIVAEAEEVIDTKESRKGKGLYAKLFGKGEDDKKSYKKMAEPVLPSYTSEDAFFYGSEFTPAKKEQFAMSVGLNVKKNDSYSLVSRKPGRICDLKIESFPFVIGSLSYAVDGYINDTEVSRFHARIDKKENMFYLTDLNTQSGTYINRERIEINGVRTLQVGDTIGIGSYEFRFLQM